MHRACRTEQPVCRDMRLRSDEQGKLPGCLDGVDLPRDQLNTVIHEGMHMVLNVPVTGEARVVAISQIIQPRKRK